MLQRLIAISIALATTGLAQEAGGSVRVRLLSFSAAFSVPEAYIFDPAGKPDAVPTKAMIKEYLNHESQTVTLAGRKIAVSSSKDRASLARPDQLLGEVTLPEGAQSVILLFLPSPEVGKSKYKILAINDDTRAFPPGSFHISNFSPQPVRITLEKETFDFKPGDTKVVTDPPAGKNHLYDMSAKTFKNDEWQRVASGVWPNPGRGRVLQIIHINPVSGQIQLRGFDDVPPRPMQDNDGSTQAPKP